jgi:hypothetical protein
VGIARISKFWTIICCDPYLQNPDGCGVMRWEKKKKKYYYYYYYCCCEVHKQGYQCEAGRNEEYAG